MNQIVISDIPRIFTALAEWLACVVYLSQCPKRMKGTKYKAVVGGFLLLQCLWLELTGTLELVFWIPCMMAAVGLMFGFIVLCGDIPTAGAGYCTARAFLLAELIASLEWQLYYYAAYSLGYLSNIVSLAFLGIIYSVGFLLVWSLECRWQDSRSISSFSAAELWPPVVIALTSFVMSNLSFIYSNTPFSSTGAMEILNIRTLVALSGFITLYAYHSQRGKLFAERELSALQSILQNQYVQYRQSRESIDVINRKYHDLKHQIAVLRAEQDAGKRLAFLDQMEDEIKSYEAQNKTGNSVLDTVLTGKSLYCSKHQIELTCMADGAQLSFMNVMDICTIFGNSLDNAIEYEMTIPEKEKRLIHLSVFTRKNFLVIRVKNYFEGQISLREGLPVTTKSDANYHGFGLKSIRCACEKYGGSMKLDTQNSWFTIQLLIPLPSN